MTKANLTEIVFVLDRSGSMGIIRDDCIGGFNTFLKDQQALPGEARLTLTQFDDVYEVVYKNKPIQEVEPLTTETFVPRGRTALLDAIGRTVNVVGAELAAMSEDERPEKLIFVIVTDGEENASKEFTRQRVLEGITHQRENYQWEFVFMAANQDAIAAAGDIGIQPRGAMNFVDDGDGARHAFSSVSKGVSNYRTKGSTGNLGS